jgi:hypothetical protein
LNKNNGLFLCKGKEFSEDRKEWEDLVDNINISFDEKFSNS